MIKYLSLYSKEMFSAPKAAFLWCLESVYLIINKLEQNYASFWDKRSISVEEDFLLTFDFELNGNGDGFTISLMSYVLIIVIFSQTC